MQNKTTNTKIRADVKLDSNSKIYLVVDSTSASQGDVVAYSQDYSTELRDNDIALNSNVVVASKRVDSQIENTFSYYTVKYDKCSSLTNSL